jgi:hypothetical protein
MTDKQRIEEQELKDREEVIRLFNGLFKDVRYKQLPISATTDITVTASTTNKVGFYNIEIKERDIPINRFNNCFLEVMKYDSLKDTYTDHKPLYIALYPTNRTACIWSVNDLDFSKIIKTKRWMNKSTYCNKEKILKEVYLLPISAAKQYKY